MSRAPTRPQTSYSPEAFPFLTEVQWLMCLKMHNPTDQSLISTLHPRLRPVLLQVVLLLTYPRQRIANEHVYHPRSAEAGVH